MRIATRNQRTIAGLALVCGFGYWSGQDVCVEFRPAGPGTGLVFVRRDLAGCPRIPAGIHHRVETQRRTTLRAGEACVEMVEHVMAALAGLGIDNCEIWTDAAEMPGCDGSSLPFVGALDAAGIVQQRAARPVRVIRRTEHLGSEDSWVETGPAPPGQCILEYQLDYGPQTPIGRQTFRLSLTPDSFRRELAPCRTYLLKAEAHWLLAQGLGLRTTCRDLLVFDAEGPIDNQLRFPDECVRHKLLDMVGDLALAGCDLAGRFTAHRSGHRLNAELVRLLVDDTQTACQRRHCA